MSEDLSQFTSLRQSIIQSITPLMDDASMDPSERFSILSRLAQTQGSLEYYQKAFDVAQQLDQEEKLRSLLSLLNDVDFEIDERQERPSESNGAEDPTVPEGQQ